MVFTHGHIESNLRNFKLRDDPGNCVRVGGGVKLLVCSAVQTQNQSKVSVRHLGGS